MYSNTFDVFELFFPVGLPAWSVVVAVAITLTASQLWSGNRPGWALWRWLSQQLARFPKYCFLTIKVSFMITAMRVFIVCGVMVCVCQWREGGRGHSHVKHENAFL